MSAMNKTYTVNFNEINDIKSLKKLQSELNEGFENRLSELNILDKANMLAESSFGHIKNCFEEITPILFESNDGRKLIGKYVSTIKNNPTLSKIYRVYESVRRTGKDTDVDYFLTNLKNDVSVLNKLDIKEATKALGEVLKEAYIKFNNQISEMPKENVVLNESIDYILENDVNIKNLPEFSLSIKNIREDIESREHSIKTNKKNNIDETFDTLIESFNEKYNDNLTEEEIKIVNTILSSDNKENIFNEYVNECLNKINEKKKQFIESNDNSSANRLDTIYEQIKNKKYSKDTIVEDIHNIMEITEIFG